MFKSQIVRLALNRQKLPEMGPEWSPGLENPPQMNPTVVPKRLGPVPRPKTLPKWAETPKSACPGGGSQVRLLRFSTLAGSNELL